MSQLILRSLGVVDLVDLGGHCPTERVGGDVLDLFAMSVAATVVDRGGPGYLNVLAMLFAWNAIKIAVVGVMTPLRWLSVVADRSNHVDRDTAVAP